MITIKTGSWFTPLPADHIRIGISRGSPRYFAAGYRIYRRLAPGPWFNSSTASEFTELYRQILDRLDPAEVLRDLQRISYGKTPVLCCFERVGGPQWCHRSLAASWLAQSLGIEVPELGHEGLPQALHPLRAPEMLVP